jgi:FeS cluster assembly scaffold protein NifU
MKSTQYSEKVLDHFRNPRNVGTLEGPDVHIGKVGNPVCGDLMEFYIKVKEDRIEDIKFKTFGCGSAIATASMITELAKGKTIDEALKITRKDVADELDGLPPIKMHCSNLAADALKDAIHHYQEKQKPATKKESKPDGERGIIGLEQFMGHGVYEKVDDLEQFRDKRVMVLERGAQSVKTALELVKLTPRVIFVTRNTSLTPDTESKILTQSKVKVLYESEVLEIRWLNTVEKVLIHDLNEDEEYELFVDSIITLEQK